MGSKNVKDKTTSGKGADRGGGYARRRHIELSNKLLAERILSALARPPPPEGLPLGQGRETLEPIGMEHDHAKGKRVKRIQFHNMTKLENKLMADRILNARGSIDNKSMAREWQRREEHRSTLPVTKARIAQEQKIKDEKARILARKRAQIPTYHLAPSLLTFGHKVAPDSFKVKEERDDWRDNFFGKSQGGHAAPKERYIMAYGGQQPVVQLKSEEPFYLSPRTKSRRDARARKTLAETEQKRAEVARRARDASNVTYWKEKHAWDVWEEKHPGEERPGGGFRYNDLYGPANPRMAYSAEPRALLGENLPTEFYGSSYQATNRRAATPSAGRT